MAQNKSKEYIAHGLNLDIMEAAIGRVNSLDNIMRDTYDMNSIGSVLSKLFCHTESENINGHKGEFCFTMSCGSKPLGKRHKRKKVREYMYKLNTYTNEITCTDECGNELTIPLINDNLSLISDTAIELVIH